MSLIKGGRAIQDDWINLAEDVSAPSTGDVIVSLERFRQDRDALFARSGRLGVRLASDADVAELADDLSALSLIALEFPRFADGRAYSSAALLRQRYGFIGEIRAIGDVLPDQLSFMARCGFDAFEIAHDDAEAVFKTALSELGHVYQSAADGRSPVWRQRQARRVAVAAE